MKKFPCFSYWKSKNSDALILWLGSNVCGIRLMLGGRHETVYSRVIFNKYYCAYRNDPNITFII